MNTNTEDLYCQRCKRTTSHRIIATPRVTTATCLQCMRGKTTRNAPARRH